MTLEEQFEGHTYSTVIDGERREWKVTDLWRASSGLPPKELLPSEIPEYENLLALEVGQCWGQRDETGKPIGGYTFSRLVFDVERMLSIQKRGLDGIHHAVLLGPDGRVMDGLHRLILAHAAGETVLVVQFDEWP